MLCSTLTVKTDNKLYSIFRYKTSFFYIFLCVHVCLKYGMHSSTVCLVLSQVKWHYTFCSIHIGTDTAAFFLCSIIEIEFAHL